MKLQYIKVAVFFAFIISAGIFLLANEVEAAAGDIVITVHDQFDNVFTDGAFSAASIACPGGTAVQRINGNGGGDIVFLAADIGNGTTAECDNGEAFTVETVTMDGFVEIHDTSLTSYSTALQNSSTVNLVYSHKLNVVDELGNPITPDNAYQLDGEGYCYTFVGNSAYCAFGVGVENDDYYIVEKDGYVSSGETQVHLASSRELQTDPQVVTTMTSGNGLKFSHKIIVKDELNSPLTPTTVTAGLNDTSCTVVANSAYCPVLTTEDDALNGTTAYSIVKDGYVTAVPNLSGNRTENWNAQQVLSMDATNGLKFSHKISGIKDELGNNLIPEGAIAGLQQTPCVVNNNNAYCPLILADDNTLTNGYAITKDGYVQNELINIPLAGNRTSASDPQQVVVMDSGDYLRFSYKITNISSEVLAADLTAVTDILEVGNDVGRNTCVLSFGAWYCPVTLANSYADDGGLLVARVVVDGYVEKNNYLLNFGLIRQNQDDQQNEDTILSVQYGLKATVTKQVDATALTTAIVVAGNNYGTTCTENGVTGIYYCAVPLADTDTTVKATAGGYAMGSANHTDRTLHTNAQQTVSIALQAAAGGNSGGGSAGGPAPRVLPSAPIEPEVTPPTVIKDIITKINEEAALIFAQADPINYFKNIGTESTLALGAGERGAAIASFIDAYGRKPRLLADWIDILNIANGRWPLTVNRTVEARAYLNFRAVYGRNADMKNSTDVNALKMMGYGTRSTKPRDLTIERIAITRFKTVFGFNPITARHWNIIRAIAYSDVI